VLIYTLYLLEKQNIKKDDKNKETNNDKIERILIETKKGMKKKPTFHSSFEILDLFYGISLKKNEPILIEYPSDSNHWIILQLEDSKKMNVSMPTSIWPMEIIGKNMLDYSLYPSNGTQLSIVGKKKEYMDDFLKNAYAHYEKKMNEEKQSIYVYNMEQGYWEKFQDMVERPLCTIFLDKENTKENIIKEIEEFLSIKAQEKYKNFGVPYRKTFCFHGPPGSGKTSFIHSIASFFQRNICIFHYDPKMTDKDIMDSLICLPASSFLVFEDYQTLSDKESTNISFSTWINILDGFMSIEGLVIFLTTNFPEKIDPLHKRPGRIDTMVSFSFITLEQIHSMLSFYFPGEEKNASLYYEKIKHKNMTCCYFQKFLFTHYPEPSHLFSNFKKYVEEYDKLSSSRKDHCSFMYS